MTPLYQKIVMAYIDTGPGDAVLCRGAELARLCRAELHLVGIVATEGGMPLDPASASHELLETERTHLQEALTESVGHLDSWGVAALTCIRDGDPAREITAFVREIGADLVVVGHSDRRFLAHWGENSEGTGLLEQLPCSLLVAMDRFNSKQTPGDEACLGDVWLNR